MHLPPSVVLERDRMRLLLSNKSIYVSLILILLDYDVDESSGTSNQVRDERERGRRKNSRVERMDIQQGWPTLPPKARSHRLITILLSIPSNLKYNLRLKVNISWRMKVHSPLTLQCLPSRDSDSPAEQSGTAWFYSHCLPLCRALQKSLRWAGPWAEGITQMHKLNPYHKGPQNETRFQDDRLKDV